MGNTFVCNACNICTQLPTYFISSPENCYIKYRIAFVGLLRTKPSGTHYITQDYNKFIK